MELICPVKQYHWGKQGSHSLVARLKQNADLDFKFNEEDMYAELWMGTHPSGPAFIKNSNTPLSIWLEENESELGDATIEIFGKNLPFLFKILSVNMPLSIQVHPSQNEARELHAKYPETYKDPNHKPELAIALSDFEALCGFRPVEEIKGFLKLIPELSELIGESKVNNFLTCTEAENQNNLKSCFTSLMHASDAKIQSQLDSFFNKMAKENEDKQTQLLFHVISKIHKYFPADVGCFCVYFLNYLILKPGEAIFLEANQPHAYIFGDCVECMACSDNVVRAGLTPKFRDVDTLCRILNYTPASAESKLLIPYVQDDCSMLYRPPVKEFAVRKLTVRAGSCCELELSSTPSIFIVVEGCGKVRNLEVSKGKIFFVGAGQSYSISVPECSSETLLIFQAFVNI